MRLQLKIRHTDRKVLYSHPYNRKKLDKMQVTNVLEPISETGLLGKQLNGNLEADMLLLGGIGFES